MTDYEKVEKELLRLGYTREQGKGDHMKFTKAGVRRPISVSLSISGRTLLNAISNIRKIEPDFQLGRTATSKATEKTAAITENVLKMSDEERQYARRFAFISVGQKVRYVTAEGRDWEKLKDKNSVMNMPYVVKEILSDTGHAYVSTPDDLIGLACDNHEMTLGPEDLASWDLRKCRSCGKSMPVNEFDTAHSDLCDNCYEQLTGEIKKLSNKLPIKEIDKLTSIVELKTSTREKLKEYQGKTISDLPVDLLTKITKETDEWLLKKKVMVNEKTRGELPKVQASANLYSRWKIHLSTLKTYYEVTDKNNHNDVRVRKETCREILLSSYSETELKKWKVFNIVCAPNVSGIMADNAIYLYEMLREYYKTDDVLVRCRCKGSDFSQYIPIRELAERQNEFLKANLDDEDYRHECSIVRAFTAVQNESELKETGLKVVDYWREHGVLTPEEAGKIIFKARFAPMYNDFEQTPACGVPPSPVIYLCFKDRDVAERLSSESELLAPTLREAGVDAYTEVILQDESELSLTGYGTTSINGEQIERRPYEDPYDIIDVKLGIERTLYDALKDCADLEDKNMTDFLTDILNDYIDDDDKYERINLKPLKDMAKTNETPTSVYSSLDSVNPTSPDECLREKTTRELLRELKGRGVTFEGVSIPVVTRQSVDLDEI